MRAIFGTAGIIFATFLGIILMTTPDTSAVEQDDILYIDLLSGRIVIEMRPDLAPVHVARIKELVREGYYDGLKWHRVMEGFMAQTGDPNGNGSGGSGQKLKAEFSNEPHVRGIVSMARAPHPDSADSQFFIMLGDNDGLDGNYTVWGRVLEGMDFVDGIKKGDMSQNGAVRSPDIIVRARMAADIEE
jgi:peptidylprolyl isomerase